MSEKQNNQKNPYEAKRILAEVSAMISNRCACGHAVQAHYPLHYFMTGCKVEDCDCLEFEGV